MNPPLTYHERRLRDDLGGLCFGVLAWFLEELAWEVLVGALSLLLEVVTGLF